MPASFSLEEAAAIADLSEFEIRKAIAVSIARPRPSSADRSPRHGFDARDILYLTLINDLPFVLREEDQKALWNVVLKKRGSAGCWHWSDGDLVFDAKGGLLRVSVKQMRSSIAGRLRTVLRGRDRVVSSLDVLGGEPVFKGTRIPLAHIAGLFAKNVPLDEIREDYPALSQRDLDYAALIARMKRSRKRPRKSLSLIRGGRLVTTKDRPAVIREASSG